MRSLSIKLQLSLMVSFLALVIVAVLSIVAYIKFEESLLGNIDTTLRYMGGAIRAELEEKGVPPENREAAFRAITGHDASGHPSQCHIWMEGSEEDLFTSDSPGASLAPGLLHPPAEERPDVGDLSLFNIAGVTESRAKSGLRALWMRRALQGQVVNILVARPSGQLYYELEEFLRLLLVSGGSVTLIVLLLVPRIVSWGLRSVTYAGKQLGQITHRNLAQDSMMTGSVPAELGPFKSALDGMLGRMNEAMRQQERLTADVAHELRTPLAVITSTLQILRMQPRTTTEYEEGVDDALQDLRRMAQLVGQLLTLARLDAVDKIPDPVEVRLDILLESLAEVFADRAEQQGASVVYTRSEAVCVQGDEAELRQLFTNLIENALRYGPQNGMVCIALQDGPSPWVTVCVHDRGGAIPPEVLPHLFDRFYRGDSSRSQASGGTGLGLAIVREIVLRHHGDIVITSDPHTGTTVTVRLPRK